ncbi:MAG: aminoacyl-tRNA hydrolase [Chloroflexi bacterium]|nr:aminoacyl-tRNA hydrolase [Chloroflexota bacterium]
MRLIAGLGNPGAEYAHNRHNVGFQCVDAFAAAEGVASWRRQARALVAQGIVGGERVVLIKPQTFMNLSGEAVAELARWYKVAPADVIVVCDDLDLPLGRIRIRPEGGAGGHRGIASIVERLGTMEFPRIRVGIGRPEVAGPAKRAEVSRHVLDDFSREEEPIAREACERVAGALRLMIAEGIERAMNVYNRKS